MINFCIMTVKEAVEYVNKLVNKYGQYGPSWRDYKYSAHRIDDTTAFAYNNDFLVIAHENRIYVFDEDDGSFIYGDYDKYIPFSFSTSFSSSLIQLIAEINRYVTMVGIPYHYKPECVTRCGFALGVEIDKEKY